VPGAFLLEKRKRNDVKNQVKIEVFFAQFWAIYRGKTGLQTLKCYPQVNKCFPRFCLLKSLPWFTDSPKANKPEKETIRSIFCAL
jgi:hypothetical protein